MVDLHLLKILMMTNMTKKKMNLILKKATILSRQRSYEETELVPKVSKLILFVNKFTF